MELTMRTVPMRVPLRGVVFALALVLAVAAGAFTARAVLADPPPSRVILSVESLVFSSDALEVAAGSIVVTVANTDAVAHTFTVPELDVDLDVAGSEARSITFEAPPGTYRFECVVPGHTGPGMRGTLEVRE